MRKPIVEKRQRQNAVQQAVVPQDQNAPADEADYHQVVTIIGAGIAGLSAAHELVERGFIVQVIEPRESQFDEHECEVGGLAASQYSRTSTTRTCHPELFHADDIDIPDWQFWDEPPLGGSGGTPPPKGGRRFHERYPKPQLGEATNIQERRTQNQKLLNAIRANTMRSTQPKLPFVERIVFDSNTPDVEPNRLDAARSTNEAKLNTICVKILWAIWVYYNDLVVDACHALFDQGPSGRYVEKHVLDTEVLIREIFLLEVRGNCGMGSDTELNQRAWQRAVAVKEAIVKRLAKEIRNAAPGNDKALMEARKKIDCARYSSDVDLDDAVIAYWDALAQLGYTGDKAEDIGKHLVVRVVQTDTHSPMVESQVSAFHYVDFHCVEHVLPGEHGYRYFPSFYHNLFETMQRTPIIDEDGNSTFETVYERLIHPPTVSLATKKSGLVRSPKQLPPSLEEGASRMKTILEDLEVTSRDLQLATNRLLKMATSCQARRKKYEAMSWLSFVNGESELEISDPQKTADGGPGPYSQKGAHVLRTLPQSLIAMCAEESDARSYGIAAIQNVRDYQAEQLAHTDRMLNGPTSDVWLRHWKRYLKSQNVRFFVGHVEKLVVRNGHLVPIIVGPTADRRPQSELPYANFIGPKMSDVIDPKWKPSPHDSDPDDTDYYVLAVPLEAAAKLIAEAKVIDESKLKPVKGRLPADTSQWVDRQFSSSGQVTLDNDLGQLCDFVNHIGLIQGGRHCIDRSKPSQRPKPRFKNPMRDFAGIQFYFSKYVQVGGSYVYYPSSDWKLTSIAQVFLWHTRPSLNVGYIGGLSVDIGDMYTPFDGGASVWQCTPRDVAEKTWAQIVSMFKRPASPTTSGSKTADNIPRPQHFHIDSGLRFDDTQVVENSTPFMIALPGQFAMRPGLVESNETQGADLDTTFSYPTTNPSDKYDLITYRVSNAKWVLCASYMPSHTRINTMEAAVEIGRHAANAIVSGAGDAKEKGKARRARAVTPRLPLGAPTPFGNQCDIYNMERDENPNFEALKRLDVALMAEKLPHFLDILRTFQLIKLAPDVEVRSNADGLSTALGPSFEDLAKTLQNAIQRKLDVTNAFFDWMEKGRGQ